MAKADDYRPRVTFDITEEVRVGLEKVPQGMRGRVFLGLSQSLIRNMEGKDWSWFERICSGNAEITIPEKEAGK